MNWKSILATALVTGAVTLLTGVLLFWWQTKEPELVYSSLTSIPFIDTKESLYIQNIDIKNTGDTFLENIILKIDFSEGKIEKSRVQIDPTIAYAKDVKEKSVTLNIANLNENERVKISLLLNSAGKDPIEPHISLRAKNVIGKIDEENKIDEELTLLISLVSAYFGLATAFLATKRGRFAFRRASGIILQKELSRNQRYRIASALAMYGLPDQAKEYLNSPAPREYWVEADFLGSHAIASDDRGIQEKMIKVLEILLLTNEIATSSKAIIMYNIARIYHVLGDSVESSKKMESSMSFNREIIGQRLKSDPILMGLFDV